MSELRWREDRREYMVDIEAPFDLAIPLRFDGPQPNHFGAPRASAQALEIGRFFGDTRAGGSCNCEMLTLTPHCNGTHTECVGHLTDERHGLDETRSGLLGLAVVVSIAPESASETSETSVPGPQRGDRLVTARALRASLDEWWGGEERALVVRTLPNGPEKRNRRYEPAQPAPYLSAEAAELLVEAGVDHLLVDVPSIDRSEDEGFLTAHRIFWGLPETGRSIGQAARANATVTELIYVPNEVADGRYLLDLQVPAFASDAAPSRPLLYRIRPL